LKITTRLGIAAAALLPAALGAVPATAATMVPQRDGFYTSPRPLVTVKPGTVLRTRRVAITLGSTTMTGSQVLYRTTNQIGLPAATVATILAPTTPTGSLKLLSYQTPYDGIAATARPSYALRTGNSQDNSILAASSGFINSYLQQGYTVMTSDFEGPTDDFGAGRESGYGTLDAIRAADHQLHVSPRSTRVALTGYSGGSIASMWAAQLQPRYAPDVDLIGVAAGGIPVDFAHNQAYIDGSSDWAGVIPANGIGLARAYGVDLARMLNATGRRILNQAQAQGVLTPTGYPGLRFADLFKAKYKNWRRSPEYVRIFNDSILGRTGTPKVPVFMAVGDRDGIGDGVMIVKDVQQLAHTYCSRGLRVQFHVYANSDHTAAFVHFVPEANTYLQGLYAGQTAPSDCPVTPGNPLTPLATPRANPQFDSGITIGQAGRFGSRYTMRIEAPNSALANVTLTVYRRSGNGLKRLTIRRVGSIGAFDSKSLHVTLPASMSGTQYVLSAAGQLQTERVANLLRIRAG
jgi:pimeloyl-ACP methyl ester carboxylesterase